MMVKFSSNESCVKQKTGLAVDLGLISEIQQYNHNII